MGWRGVFDDGVKREKRRGFFADGDCLGISRGMDWGGDRLVLVIG